jgi:hypothetical protein
VSGARLAARLVLIAVFAVSAGAKLADRAGSRRAAAALGVPARYAGMVAAALPGVELAAAGLLAIWSSAFWGALLALVLLAAFTVAIVGNLGQGRRPDCHCFGQLRSRPISWWSVARNVVLAVPAVFLVLTA